MKKQIFFLIPLIFLALSCIPTPTEPPVTQPHGEGIAPIQEPSPIQEPTPPQIPEPAKSAKIAFARNFGSYYGFDICTANSDGTDIQRITKTASNSLHPSWSPDGTKIVFDSTREGFNLPSIYVMEADGNNIKYLTPKGEFCQRPVWSPDGTKIAYCVMWLGLPDMEIRGASEDSFISSADKIFVMDSNGDNKKEITSGWAPSWLDNNCLVYMSWPTGTWEIYSIDISNLDTQRHGNCNIRFQSGLFPTLKISPDGNSVAFDNFNLYLPYKRDIYIMSLTSGEKVNLTKSLNYNCYCPTWSPDGTKIAFTVELGEKFNVYTNQPEKETAIYVINTDGSNPILLIENGVNPSWQKGGGF